MITEMLRLNILLELKFIELGFFVHLKSSVFLPNLEF